MAEEDRVGSGRSLRVVWLTWALSERDAQLRYIEGENRSAGLGIDAQIDSQADLLAGFPYMGRMGREPGTREMVINRSPFILVYRILQTRIEILRFLHGWQQWPPKFGTGSDFASLEEES